MIMDLDDKILDEWVDEKADLKLAIAKQKDFIFFIKLLLESKLLLYGSLHQTSTWMVHGKLICCFFEHFCSFHNVQGIAVIILCLTNWRQK